MRESQFQSGLIKRINGLFPGCFILKNDSSYVQGVPDLIVLYESFWAMLEVKKSISARTQPNQDYWVEQLNQMSFAAYVYPENVEDVLYELQRAFGLVR